MKICIPTKQDRGLDSLPYGHFGSAPYFIICDTESDEVRTINNRDQDHEHGACLPAVALGDAQVDAVVVGGMGVRALSRLQAMGIKAYRSMGGTVGENLGALKQEQLAEMSSREACRGHGHDHDHHH